MGTSQRSRKVADRIKVVVAELLEGKIKDPRLGFVTITDVRITGDLQHASIFYTVLGDEEDRDSTAAALESAKGVIRSTVGREIGVRVTPYCRILLGCYSGNGCSYGEATRRDSRARCGHRGSSCGREICWRGEPV